MLLMAIWLEVDVFQGWKKFIKGKGDEGSQSLPTACQQLSEKWNKMTELKGSAREEKHNSMPVVPNAPSLLSLRKAFRSESASNHDG